MTDEERDLAYASTLAHAITEIERITERRLLIGVAQKPEIEVMVRKIWNDAQEAERERIASQVEAMGPRMGGYLEIAAAIRGSHG